MEFSNDEILAKFPPKLRRNIKELWTEKIGISSAFTRICLHPRKFAYDCDVSKANSFTIDIPYAGKHLNWEIIFNDEDLSFAPDFEFANDSFLLDPEINVIEKEVPSWAKWDTENPKALITILKDLFRLYQKYQLLKLQEHKFSRQFTEYILLTKDNDVSEDDIEVFIDINDTVHMLIGITLDFSKLPPYLQKQHFQDHGYLLNPCQDTATIKVSFPGNKTFTSLQLSPRVEQILGNSNQLHIPTYNRDSGLVQFIPAVTKLLKTKVDYVTKQYKFRKEYITHILSYVGQSIMEYDSHTFSMITFFLKVDTAFAIVVINITKKFPIDKPIVRLTSFAHETDGKPLMEVQDNYPFSHKWPVELMVKNLLNYLIKAIPNFKLTCINSNVK